MSAFIFSSYSFRSYVRIVIRVRVRIRIRVRVRDSVEVSWWVG